MTPHKGRSGDQVDLHRSKRARFWNYFQAESDAEIVLRAMVESHKKNASTRAKNDSLTEVQKDNYEVALDVLGLPRDYLDLGRG